MRKLNRPPCPNPGALIRNYKHSQNKDALIAASDGKCMYCESKTTHVYFGDIEHIKPKAKFPELEYEWLNLGFVCAQCNNAKGGKYEAVTPYIDPYSEDPEDFLVTVGVFLRNKLGNQRGDITIIDIHLNRPELIEKRKERMKQVENAINACFRTSSATVRNNALESLKEESQVNKEYSLFIKTLFKLHGI